MKKSIRIFTKIFALLLFVVVLFAFGTNNIKVEGDFDWGHYQAENFAGGDGSEATPYQITTPQEFAILEFADKEEAYEATHDKHYVIMNDIELIQYDWKETWFYGTLSSASNANYKISNVIVVDGESMFENAYTIKNVTFDNVTGKSIVDTQTDTITIGEEDYIEGIQLEKCYITNSHLNSGFVNSIILTADKSIKINNCYAVDSYFASNVDDASIGGIVGYASFKNVSSKYGDFITACSINNCDFLAKKGQVIGGILGSLISDTNADRISVTNCTCENSHLRGNDCIIGGILGCLDSTNATNYVFLQECSTFGGGICGSTTTIDTKSICGGIVGEVKNANNSTISLCSNAMPVSGGIIMGGIVGNVGADVSNLTISSTVNKALIDNLCGNDYENDEISYLGGIVGKADCDYVSFNKVVNLGNVFNYKDNCYVGGFAGYLDTEVAYGTTQIETSYTACVVKSVYPNTPTNCNTHYDFGYAASANVNTGHKLNNSYYGSEFNDESGIYVGQVRTALTKFSTDFNTIAKTKIEIYSLSIGSKPVAGTSAYYLLPAGSNSTSQNLTKYYIYVYEGYGTYEGEDITKSSLYNNFYPFSNLAEAIASLNNYVDEEGNKFTPNIYSYISDSVGEYIVLNQNVVVNNSNTIKNKAILNLNGEISVSPTNLNASTTEYIYKVSYDKNGGTGEDFYQLIHSGNRFTTLANQFSRAGYEYCGWNDGVDTYQDEDDYSYPVTSNIILKAVWDANSITIKFARDNENATGNDPEDIIEDCDETIVLPANPYTLTKKIFVGWSDGENTYEAGSNYTVPTDNITLKAVWDDLKYYLVINANGGTGTMENIGGYFGDTVTMPECTITPPEGKMFRTWGLGYNGYQASSAYNPGDTYTINKEYNQNLYAVWVDIVTITFTAGDHGTGEDVVVEAGKGLSYTLPENNYFEADTGYEFLNWYIVDYSNPAYPSSKTKAPGESVVLNGATAKITAKYDLAKLNLTFDGNGKTSGEQEVVKVKPNEYCVLPECTFEKTGYKFNGWLDEDNNILYHPGVIYKMPEADYELKAQWLSISTANFQVGSYNFPTFESALEFASSGDTIRLLNNLESTEELTSIRTIIIDKNITLDLYNHHISEYAGKYNLDDATTLAKAGYYYMIVNEGVTLTITDTSSLKKGYFETSYININQESSTPFGYGIYAKGNVTLTNGTIQNSVNSRRTTGSLNTIYMYSSSTSSNSFIMSNGTIKMQDNTYLIKSYFNSNYDVIINTGAYTSTKIYGGTFTGSTSNTISKIINSNSSLQMSNGTVDLMDYIEFMPFVVNAGATISNCTFGFDTSSMANLFTASYEEEVVFNNDTFNIGGTIINLGNVGASAIFNDCTVTGLRSYSFVTGSGTVTINSGTYTNTYNPSGFFTATGGVYIVGGTFISSKALKGVATENVSGGKFSAQVPANSVMDGYYAITTPDEDGYYTVAEFTSKEDAYAILNYGEDSEEYYASIPQALLAAAGKENAVITVNKTHTENSVIEPAGICKIVIPDGITLTCQGFYVSKVNCSGETLLIEEGGSLILTADTGLRGIYGTCTMTNNGTITTKGIYDAVAGWVNNGTISITSSYSPYVTNFTNNGTITGTVSFSITVKGATIQSTIDANKLYIGVYSYNKTTNELEPSTRYLLVRNGEPVSLYYGTDISEILQDGDVVKLVANTSSNMDALTINHNITLDGNGYKFYTTLIINNSCTLKDVQMSSTNINVFSSNGNVEITLVGDNAIESSANYPVIISNGNVRFIGNGNLEVISTHESQNAIKIDGDLVINANVSMECNSKCILIGQSNSLTISNGTYKAKLYQTFDNEIEEDFELTITGGRFIENVKASLGENYHTMYEDDYYYVRYLVVSLDNISLDYGNSLGLVFEFTIDAYDEESISALILTSDWRDATINKVSDNKFEIIYNDIIMYKFNELFNLQLNVDGESFEFNDLSVKELLVRDLNNEPSDELKDLIYSIIAYADAAQLYNEYDVENLLSTGIDGYVAPTFANLLSTDTNLVHATEIESIYACGVYYDYVNKLYAKFNVSEIAELNVYIDDVKVSEEELIDLGNGNYKVYTDGFNPDKFDKVFTFKVYDGETLIDTLEYSFASYVYAKQENTNANANLCKAAYNYYLATLEYLK